jgi:outer membrane protein
MRLRSLHPVFLTVIGIAWMSAHAQTPPPAPATETPPSLGSKLETKLETALGDTPANKLPPKMLPKWELGLGVGAVSMPDYRGSDHQSTVAFPIPYVIYRGTFFKADRSGVRTRFLDSEYLDLELSLNGGVPVSSKHNEARQGMPDLDPTLEIGPQAIIRIVGKARDVTRLDIRLPARQVISSSIRDEGWVFTPALNLSITPRDGWQFGAQTGPYYATSKYHRYIYEVAPQYATATRPAYTPKGGYGGWQVTTSLSRRFEKMWFGAFVRASTVKGAVFEDSPLVRRKTNVYGGFGISWLFAHSSEMVEATDDE